MKGISYVINGNRFLLLKDEDNLQKMKERFNCTVGDGILRRSLCATTCVVHEGIFTIYFN